MPKRRLADLSPSDRLRYQLLLAGLSQAAAARELGIDERTMRKYCSGEHMVPRIFDYAMRGLIASQDVQARYAGRNRQKLEKERREALIGRNGSPEALRVRPSGDA